MKGHNMNSLSPTTTTTQDAAAIAAAKLRIDAENGADLLNSLYAKWYGEGRALFAEGGSPVRLWNPVQRAGYNAALAAALPTIDAKYAKPYLSTDDHYEDEIGDISGTGAGGDKRNHCSPIADDDDDTIDDNDGGYRNGSGIG
jgi:hypothetical protein